MSNISDELNIDDWLKFITKLHPKDIELGLDRIKIIANRLQLNFSQPIVTVAGTNGKGSCIATIAALLMEEKLNIASYTSPHILRFQERIKLQNREIPDIDLCQSFSEVERARHNVELTFFEFTTLAALNYFNKVQPDIILLEVGLGGRLDAVKICPATIAILTQISLDHTEWLGDTREQIATEKTHILHNKCQALLIGDDMPDVVYEIAKQYRVAVIHKKQYELPQLKLPTNSVILGIMAVEYLLRKQLTSQAIQKLHNLSLPGRLQRLTINNRKVILDVGHNPAAAKWLYNKLRTFSKRRLAVIFAIQPNKDWQQIINILSPIVNYWAMVGLTEVDSVPNNVLVKFLKDNGPFNQVKAFPSLESAKRAMLAILNKEDELLIFGSFFIVSEFLRLLDKRI